MGTLEADVQCLTPDQDKTLKTIITAVDTQLVSKMVPITEETCGSCQQISTSVQKIVQDLENTLTAAVPDWRTNPIYMSVTMAVNGILGIVPAFCPAPTEFKTHRC